MTHDKISAAKEHQLAYETAQTIEEFDEARKRLYPLLPIEREEKAEKCSECGGTGKREGQNAPRSQD